MNIVAVIPARYASTRLPGKPLADIMGKPMIWWVYQQVKKVKDFVNVYVATDDERIERVCRSYKMNVIMTRNDCQNHIIRVHEVAQKIDADYYVCVNGDEPMIDVDSIRKILPEEVRDEPYFCGARRRLSDPAETIDFANIKLAMSDNDRCVYMSRTPIPYPKGTLLFDYWKYVGIECFNKSGLDFFASRPMGQLEKVEDIDHLRFIEGGMQIFFKEVNSESLSVDTAKDLDKVRKMMEEMIRD
jgi:3-deoxy-manno-octulosonate cytidylyltransferase (CMP-KDO synthetase)